jgi:DNA-nicking Smr family endonuclease
MASGSATRAGASRLQTITHENVAAVEPCYGNGMSEEEGEVGIRLGSLLEPILHTLEVRQPAPETTPKPRYLDESELMALIFAHLDHENPRVCEGIEFERFEISARPPPEPEPSSAAEPSPTLEPSQSEAPAVVPELRLELEQRIGATWSDDIAAVPSDWLERPQLSPAQAQLLARAQRRALATLHLRHLDRATALRHLELFVHACQAKRVRWCRVITGKGIGSVGEPVLKRAVLEWCRGPGRTCVLEWAPQLDPHGEWGVLVVRLSSARIGGTTAP